jgi:hypothetical protein
VSRIPLTELLRCVLAVGVLVVSSSAAGARAEAEVFAREARITRVDAYAGSVVWSSYDRNRRVYRLKLRSAGRTRVLPIEPSGSQFDVSIGPDGRGGISLVYSRCRGGSSSGFTTGTSGCDVRRFDVRSGRERRVAGASSSAWTEVLPSVWGKRVAFARARAVQRGTPARPGRAGVLSQILVTTVGQPSRRLAGGTLGAHDDLHDYLGGDPGPSKIDLRGTRVAYVWELTPLSCRDGQVPDALSFSDELWLDRIGGAHELIDSSCNGAPGPGRSVALTHGQLLYDRIGEPVFGDADRQERFVRAIELGTRTFVDRDVSAVRPYDVAADERFIYLSGRGGRLSRQPRRSAPGRPLPARSWRLLRRGA